MKRILLVAILVACFCCVGSVWGLNHEGTNESRDRDDAYLVKQKQFFRQSIPSIATQFVGIPYKLGGNPRLSGTSDNSYLFFSIYALAAQEAGLSYKGYLPMAHLIHNTIKVDGNDIQNGDLMVLKNNHAAMIYRIENTGTMYLIYASEKRQEIITFNSDNIVFPVYWLENFKGFYRLSDAMFLPSNQ
ncbi:MAG: hypothetical protein B6230_06895 [Desulfobacteraceae bacterium 4572_89]|nr:MAG: hypothetical protein B6230_06895 [Desulfobacteraceae bacterium 4572_89]